MILPSQPPRWASGYSAHFPSQSLGICITTGPNYLGATLPPAVGSTPAPKLLKKKVAVSQSPGIGAYLRAEAWESLRLAKIYPLWGPSPAFTL